MQRDHLSWLSIVRLGIVQTALGAIVVLMTSTLNRVMVVELALPAMLPGALVTLHHAMQLLRPRMGYGADVGQRHTPWIVGGMAALALGGVGATFATTLLGAHFWPALALSVLSFAAIGSGVSACGTSLLVLMAKRVAQARRAAAATIVWMMMIAGFAITATVAGKLLDPFSPERLIAVVSGVCGLAFVVAVLAVWGVEGAASSSDTPSTKQPTSFRAALTEVWSEPDARRFTLFVFVSMFAYSAQDLILEPFAGAVFGFTPGESTSLSGTQHGGVFAGMLLVAVVVTACKGTPLSSLKAWVVGGCIASSIAMCGLAWAGWQHGPWPLRENVFLLGLSNGVFSIAAISSMMALATRGLRAREGTRMGLWGAAQAISFALGGVSGTILVDLGKRVLGPSGGSAYAFVFALEAFGFFVAQGLARATHFAEVFDEVALHPSAADSQST
jgi:MFS transporter, BCD family, chlorophyll transporter